MFSKRNHFRSISSTIIRSTEVHLQRSSQAILRNMEVLGKIQVSDLVELSELYEVDYPLHIATHSTIKLFTERFVKHPEWASKVDFLSFDDDWRTCGAFIMIHGNRIFFNTLESFPFNRLRKALYLLEFNEVTTLVNIRDALRPVVDDLIRVHHLEVLSDIGTKSFLMKNEKLREISIE